MSEITTPESVPVRRGLPFRIRFEPRLKDPPRWYPVAVSICAVVVALMFGAILITWSGGNPWASYAHIGRGPGSGSRTPQAGQCQFSRPRVMVVSQSGQFRGASDQKRLKLSNPVYHQR